MNKDEASAQTTSDTIRKIPVSKRNRMLKTWQRLMACLFYIPSFFSLLTLYAALQENEIKAAVVFGFSTLAFGIGGTLLWFGRSIMRSKRLQFLKNVLKQED